MIYIYYVICLVQLFYILNICFIYHNNKKNIICKIIKVKKKSYKNLLRNNKNQE